MVDGYIAEGRRIAQEIADTHGVTKNSLLKGTDRPGRRRTQRLTRARVALMLRLHAEDWTDDEIADLLSIDRSTVSHHLGPHRAKA